MTGVSPDGALDLGRDLAHRFDLVDVPYTARYSRLFVRRGDVGLTVFEAAYERPLDESVVVSGLRILDDEGREVPIVRASPAGIEFDGGVRLVVDGGEVLIGGLPELWSTPLAEELGATESTQASRSLGNASIRTSPDHDLLSPHDEQLGEWLDRCPAVDPAYRDITRFCWWVLGVNTLSLDAPEGLNRAVVPSKVGYVGLWQWDAYFIAIGLRHGDPDLAREQLRIALAHQDEDGQLPDVVHEQGVLASSDDLPPLDLENLRAMASPSLAHSRVPLTKPPLTALAVAKLAEVMGEGVVDEFLPAVLRAQEWWFTHSTRDGRPVYLHPYSSGLDDSPIFDDDAIVASPDLATYLVLSERLLAGWLDERGRDDEAAACRAQASATVDALAATWDQARGFFPAIGEDGDPIEAETIVSLMPLLADRLPGHLIEGILAAIDDPARFATPHALPTVAASDPDYSTERMWRGPVWVNTNWLVAEGLRRQAAADPTRADRLLVSAARLERDTLALVDDHGPNEYFNPVTGERPLRATTVFGWSAALAVDLAVRLSAAIRDGGPRRGR
ncbi:MGH1-like glycoside hydrolase domain-containing protein [Tessaracoccus sp. G1721]